MIVIGGGAVQITNQERLYHLMQTEHKTDNNQQQPNNQEMLYKLM